MAMTSLADAGRALAARDPVMARLGRVHGPPRFRSKPRVDERFESLARAIAFQQLAGPAAAAIWGRVRELVAGPFDEQAVLALSDRQLRVAGFSRAKTAALRDLAVRTAAGEVRLHEMGRRGDAEVVAELSRVCGIGRWTAEMFLIFSLRRLDVWPTGDLAVRSGYALAYELTEPPEPADLEGMGERFRPYRSVAASYCWRATEAVTPGEGA